jgi:nucleotide-binding universal stress UspA family protein
MRILLAIDGSRCSHTAVDTVMKQFQCAGTEVHVLAVDEWPKDLPTALAFSEGATAAAQIMRLHESRALDAERLVTETALVLRKAGFRTTGLVRNGEARQQIIDYAAEWSADLIVLGSHGRRGLNRFLLGSVSDAVVRHAPCSVEVVRGR